MLATDREEQLRDVLQRAVDGRWSAQLKPLLRLVPTIRREAAEHALQVLYRVGHAAGVMWGATQQQEQELAAPERPPLTERFWALLPD